MYGKYSFLWIGTTQVVRDAVEKGDMRRLFSLGQIRLLTSLTPDGRRVGVSPTLTMEAGTEIVSVALADVHEFVFLFASLRQAFIRAPVDVVDALDSATDVGGNDVASTAPLYGWLGLAGQSGIKASDPSADVIALFGPVGRRGALIAHAEECLPGVAFSKDQRRVLESLSHSVCSVFCVAGNGKTLMLVALALWLLSRASTSDGRRLLLMYMAPTNAMAREFHDLLRRAQLEPGRVSLMGGGEKKDVDLLAAHLETQAKVMLPGA